MEIRHYTATLPQSLLEALYEKGMPAARRHLIRGLTAHTAPTPVEEMPNYGTCFEWFDENGIAVGVVRELRRRENPFRGYVWKKYNHDEELSLRELQPSYFYCNTWHEAANAAIEKALELI